MGAAFVRPFEGTERDLATVDWHWVQLVSVHRFTRRVGAAGGSGRLRGRLAGLSGACNGGSRSRPNPPLRLRGTFLETMSVAFTAGCQRRWLTACQGVTAVP